MQRKSTMKDDADIFLKYLRKYKSKNKSDYFFKILENVFLLSLNDKISFMHQLISSGIGSDEIGREDFEKLKNAMENAKVTNFSFLQDLKTLSSFHKSVDNITQTTSTTKQIMQHIPTAKLPIPYRSKSHESTIRKSPYVSSEKKTFPGFVSDRKASSYSELPYTGLKSNLSVNRVSLDPRHKNESTLQPYFLSEAKSVQVVANDFLMLLRNKEILKNSKKQADFFSMLTKFFHLSPLDQQIFFKELSRINPNDEIGEINSEDYIMMQAALHNQEEKLLNLNISPSVVEKFSEYINLLIQEKEKTVKVVATIVSPEIVNR